MPDDMKLVWTSTATYADINIVNNDVEHDDGLETAVLISLFCDARARDDDELPDTRSSDRRGWWGDLVNPAEESDSTGSRLWLLSRAKTTQETLVLCEQYVREAVQWFITDGVATSIEVDVERQGTEGVNDRLAFNLKLLRDETTVFSRRFEQQWQGQFNAV